MQESLINELLLVSSALGSTEAVEMEDGTLVETFVRGENCLEWLQDLQRALRRDDENTREIGVLLASWKVVSDKLIPLLIQSIDDRDLVVTLVKLFVMTTLPMTQAAKDASRVVVDPHHSGEMKKVLHSRKDNAMKQVEMALVNKRAFVNTSVFGVLLAILEEPLSHTGSQRTDEDSQIIELVLTLIRNLLAAGDTFGELTPVQRSAAKQVHDELIVLMSGEILEIVHYLSEGINAQENNHWNLLLMEILFFLMRDKEPSEVFRTGVQSTSDSNRPQTPATVTSADRPALARGMSITPPRKPECTGLLSKQLMRERGQRAKLQQTTRHPRFTGVFRNVSRDGAVQFTTDPFRSKADTMPQAKRKRIKSNLTFTQDDVHKVSCTAGSTSPESLRSLYLFFVQFLSTGYSALMASLKEEFRRDSGRLQPGDEMYMFRLITFCTGLHRMNQQLALRRSSSATSPEAARYKSQSSGWSADVRNILTTMDIFTFNLIVRAIETYQQEKKWQMVGTALAPLKEMVYVVQLMCESDDQTHQELALGLMHRLYYAQEKLDVLPRLLKDWVPGRFTRKYLCDLVELCHVQLKLLEGARNRFRELEQLPQNQDDNDLRLKMGSAAGFAVEDYFEKLVTNSVVRMYTRLLDNYDTNTPQVNHYILALLQRMCNHKLSTYQEVPELSAAPQNDARNGELTAPQVTTVTLEPMLYNIHTLSAFNKLLNDTQATTLQELQPLLHLVRGIVRNFGRLLEKNKLMVVELLFLHYPAHAFCETLHNVYDAKHLAQANHTDLSVQHQEDDTRPPNNDDGADDHEWGEEFNDEADLPDTFTSIPEGSKGKNKGRGKQARKEGKSSRTRWTKEQDDVLREKYPLYQDTHSVYDLLALEPVLEGRSSTQLRRRVKQLGLDKANSTGQSVAHAPMETASDKDISDAESEQSAQSDDTAAQGKDGTSSDTGVNDSEIATQPQSTVQTSPRRSKKRQKHPVKKQPNKQASSLDLDDDASLKDSDNESSDDDRWNARRTFRPGYIPQGSSAKRLRKTKDVQPTFSNLTQSPSLSARGKEGLEDSPIGSALKNLTDIHDGASRILGDIDEGSSDLDL